MSHAERDEEGPRQTVKAMCLHMQALAQVLALVQALVQSCMQCMFIFMFRQALLQKPYNSCKCITILF